MPQSLLFLLFNLCEFSHNKLNKTFLVVVVAVCSGNAFVYIYILLLSTAKLFILMLITSALCHLHATNVQQQQ